MKSHVKFEVTAGTLVSMTTDQFEALQRLAQEGNWETIDPDYPIHVSGGDYIGVTLGGMFLGIEKDGYTHS